MWLAKSSASKNQSMNQSQFMPAKVSWIQGNQNFFVGAFEYRDIPVCLPYGFFSRPHKGQEILVLDSNERNLVFGAVSESDQIPSLKEGEVFLRAKSGAYIHLCDDGSISINGLKISSSGQILSNS